MTDKETEVTAEDVVDVILVSLDTNLRLEALRLALGWADGDLPAHSVVEAATEFLAFLRGDDADDNETEE